MILGILKKVFALMKWDKDVFLISQNVYSGNGNKYGFILQNVE